MSDLAKSLPDEPGLTLDIQDVHKIYRLHSSPVDMLIDVLNLQRIGIRPRTAPEEFTALRGINLQAKKGERIGIVGRNGAGKSTLLKLICGNLQPSSGNITVNGQVQALLTAGMGFNPDLTGRENVEASLQYNGIERNQYAAATQEIEEFAELGAFFDQPFRSYSAGMQARLMFGAATAVRPEILIVDEVLGAGDAYFIAKSRRRVEQMMEGGCTMLLVSHAMGQILELSERVIWIHEGQVRMEGESFEVVKAYEAFLNGTIHHSGLSLPPNAQTPDGQALSATMQGSSSSSETGTVTDVEVVTSKQIERPEFTTEPAFWPGELSLATPEGPTSDRPPMKHDFVARGGITPWEGTRQVVVSGFSIQTENGTTNQLVNLRPANFLIEVTANVPGPYELRYAITVHDYLGTSKINLCSARDTCVLQEGERRQVIVSLAPVMLGMGEYVASVGVYGYTPLEMINFAPRYDLLSRCFEFKVSLPESLHPVATEFSHPAQWHFPKS